jgi:hypothetical protein
MGGRWQQFHADDAIGQLLLDSRRLIFPATSLFFALKGPTRDGGRFVEELYKRGVRNFVLELGGVGPPPPPTPRTRTSSSSPTPSPPSRPSPPPTGASSPSP